MTAFALSVTVLSVSVVALAVDRGVRLVLRLRRIAEASAWGWEL